MSNKPNHYFARIIVACDDCDAEVEVRARAYFGKYNLGRPDLPPGWTMRGERWWRLGDPICPQCSQGSGQ